MSGSQRFNISDGLGAKEVALLKRLCAAGPGCDVVSLKVDDVAPSYAADTASVEAFGRRPLRAAPPTGPTSETLHKSSHSSCGPAVVPLCRGKVITNSVKMPGSVSTSIRPPCCLTMMS